MFRSKEAGMKVWKRMDHFTVDTGIQLKPGQRKERMNLKRNMRRKGMGPWMGPIQRV